MFSNQTVRPQDAAESLRQLGYELDPVQSPKILEELFHTWICSEEPENTNAAYRRDVVQTVNALRQLISLTQSREVGHG
jgi:hypothetical protein